MRRIVMGLLGVIAFMSFRVSIAMLLRHLAVGLLVGTFVLAGLAIAQDPPGGDDPPVRLKKKNRPDAADQPKEDPPKPAEQPKDKPKDKPKDQAKDQPKEGDDPPPAEEKEMDEAEVLNRVGKNMRTSEDRLDNAELTDATRQVQEDILKDLDSLINQQKNGGGGGGDDQQNQNQNQQQQNNDQQNQGGQKQNQGGGQAKVGMGKPKGGLKGGQQQQQAKRGQKPGQGRGQGEQMAKAGQGEKPERGGQQQPNQQPSKEGGAGVNQTPPGEPTKLAELFKNEWGHLPETMRAEMNAYSREQFMAKYNDLIKQYYSSVAEKSRKKD
jgi:hypothetical protein